MGKFFPNQDQDSEKVPSCSLSMIYSWSFGFRAIVVRFKILTGN